ncbi:MAG: GAF domain-containing protein, partial [Candidatus Limnocylindria bacterium]
MRAYLPRDVLLVGRLLALAGSVYLAAGEALLRPFALTAVAILALTSAGVWWDDLRRGGSDLRPYVIVADLATAAVWMAATATDPRSLAFVVLLAIGALAMLRLGIRGLTLTAAAYLGGRVAQEIIRAGLGELTPPVQLVGEVVVVGLVLVILGSTVDNFQRQHDRAARALRRAGNLERVAAAIAAETEPAAVLETIPRSVVALVEADHATLCVRRRGAFAIVAGAGLGARIVGVSAPADSGLVGDVLRAKATVSHADYTTHPTVLPAALELGVRAIVGVPIFVHGEFAACMVAGRLAARPFDAEDRRSLEGLASHAAIAIANARSLE